MAGKALRRFLEGRELGFDADPNQTVANYLLEWLRGKEMVLKVTTVSHYRVYVEKDLTPALGLIRLDELSHDHIAAWARRELDAKRERQTVYHVLPRSPAPRTTPCAATDCSTTRPSPSSSPRPRADERRAWTAEQAVTIPVILIHGRNADSGVLGNLRNHLIRQGIPESSILTWDDDTSQSTNEVLAGQLARYVGRGRCAGVSGAG
ncbi:hypothetical protein [Kitasatospora sp. NPDC056531]|uniref:hypothetical protein n=1 Tax=Kitasatospora sp. NPDC056531 TaxID=3345856 RepID=UPI003698035F